MVALVITLLYPETLVSPEISNYGPAISVSRLVQTRMLVVWGEPGYQIMTP